jgi:hypothetical protein
LHARYRQAKQLKLRDFFKETQEDINAMELLVALNVDNGLRYIQTGYKKFPLWSIVEPLAVRMHQAVAPLVGYRSFSKTYGGY